MRKLRRIGTVSIVTTVAVLCIGGGTVEAATPVRPGLIASHGAVSAPVVESSSTASGITTGGSAGSPGADGGLLGGLGSVLAGILGLLGL